MVKQMFCDAGIEGNFTNRSASNMCHTGVPEALVQKQTGHKSVESLRVHEQAMESQRKTATNIITPNIENFDSAYSEDDLSIFESALV